jgi:hypothetical protein
VSDESNRAENVELLRRIHESFLQIPPELLKETLAEAATFEEAAAKFSDSPQLSEFSVLLERVAPDVVIDARHGMNPFGHGGLWRGRDEWWMFWRDWLETWDDFDYEASNFEAVGDDVVMDLRIRGRGRESGVPVEWVQTQVWSFREGNVVGLRPGYETREVAIKALKREPA